jgi:hypothetical protein
VYDARNPEVETYMPQPVSPPTLVGVPVEATRRAVIYTQHDALGNVKAVSDPRSPGGFRGRQEPRGQCARGSSRGFRLAGKRS